MGAHRTVSHYMTERLKQAKIHFERTVDCKHTEFDDLYPYMNEHPQFFWYKRYVAWSELLTVVGIAKDLGIEWKSLFTEKQVGYIEKKVLEAKVLDHWYEESELEQEVE
jgi:hypothetical protein